MSNNQDASDSRRREAETLNESARRKREEAVQHRIEAFRLQLEEEEIAGKADKLDIETHYLERATISRAEDEIRATEKEILAKQQEKYREVQEANRQQLVAQLQELHQTLEQKWDQRGQYKKQLKENEIEIVRLRSKEFHVFIKAKDLEKLAGKLIKEAEEAETRAKKMLEDDQQVLEALVDLDLDLEELPHTLDN